MSGPAENSDSFSYRSRRWPLSIDVTVAGGDVRWAYRSLGDEWREQIPLQSMVPHPTITVNHTAFKIGGFSAIAVPVVCGLLLWWFSGSWIAAAVVIAIVAFALVLVMVAYRRGPIEWASFNTYYPDKNIFFFRNTGDLEFDAFIDRLRESIIDSGGACGIDGLAD